jgi:chromosomal replication initiator protein
MTYHFSEDNPLALLDTICDYLNVDKAEMLSERRARAITDKRHVAMWCYKKLTPYSYPQIGRIFNRDHTTVGYACEKVDFFVTRYTGIGAMACELLLTLDPPDHPDQLTFDLTSN